MGRIFLTIIIATLALVGVAIAPASAILNGTPDDDHHPYVGVMYTDQFLCSGAAISSTVFLTADHCIEGTDKVYVSFAEDPQPRSTNGWPRPEAAWTTGSAKQIGDFCGQESDYTCDPRLVGFLRSSDVAVVTMDKPVNLPRYALLPKPGEVNSLRPITQLTAAVGYGVDAIAQGGGRPQLLAQITRKYAPQRLIPTGRSIGDATVRAHALDPSAVCYGDSGGPLLLGDTVLGVLSGGPSPVCAGTAYYSRVDNQMLPLLKDVVGSTAPVAASR